MQFIRISIAALGVLMVCAFATSAKAQENRFVQAMLCNTAEQLETYLSLTNEGVPHDEAVIAINKEAGSHSCATVFFIGFKTDVVRTMPCNGKIIAITRYRVIAMLVKSPSSGLIEPVFANIDQYVGVIIAVAENG